MVRKGQHIWRYGGIDVMYEPEIDGGGKKFVAPLVNFIKARYGPDKRFANVFDWCAGPGFIGFGLLAEGLCDSLCLADIDRRVIESVKATIEANQLQGRARAYVSDNLQAIPKSERFDLVVGNPPGLIAPNPAHPSFVYLRGNKYLQNPKWKVHAGFYSEIAAFLEPKAPILVIESNVYVHDVYSRESTVPLDRRPEKPDTVFAEMLRKGNLVHLENAVFHCNSRTGYDYYVQVSENAA